MTIAHSLGRTAPTTAPKQGSVCQVHHEGIVATGRMHVRHDDGTEIEIGPGDAYEIEPGHDAWVLGSEVFVGYEFDSKAAETFARS